MNTGKRWPDAFVRSMEEALGAEEAGCMMEALEAEPSVSVRLNPRKWCGVLEAERVPWCESGYYLAVRPPFTFDPLLHAGAYYVQDASSMFVEQAMRVCGSPMTALDLCAAPGGKSTLLRALLPEDALLVCNEPMAKRAQVLAENITKWGHPDVIVTQSMPDAFTPLSDMFDLVLADVPCSGEGMFRKDEEAVSEWSESNVDTCWQRQREIITAVWPALRPGGALIYSTCTFNRRENEDNVTWIANTLGADIIPLRLDESWGVVCGDPGYHFYPHKVRGEGFFCAVLRKRDESPCEPADISLDDSSEHRFKVLKERGTVYALRERHASLLRQLKLTTHVIQAGVKVAEEGKAGLTPCPGLALSTALNDLEGMAGGPFAKVDVTYDEAVAYLRGEALRLNADAPRGYIIICFRSLPLGFAKNIGSRANNMYPTNWRIKSGYTKPYTLA